MNSVLSGLRAERGLSVRDLEMKAGVSKTHINAIELGVREMSAKTARKLGAALDVSPAVLMFPDLDVA